MGGRIARGEHAILPPRTPKNDPPCAARLLRLAIHQTPERTSWSRARNEVQMGHCTVGRVISSVP